MFSRAGGSFLLKFWVLQFCLHVALSFPLIHVKYIYIYFFFFTEKATDGSLQSEDWTLNMEICDIINETEEGYALFQPALKGSWTIISRVVFST